jgi:23S rRNA-/tRNA-specific pseudouridylate synthase
MIFVTSCPRSTSLHFQVQGWSSWHFQTNEYEATNLQIEQDLIQTKGVHLPYQLQVVYNDDDIRVALKKPQKWVTKSLSDCDTHFTAQMVLIKGLKPFSQN